jgi:deoxycytidine triphosphate deaminase/HAMP domain-containing protein
VQSDAEAEARAKLFKQLDPFPDIKPALLSAGDIEDYARVTAMLFPFYPIPDSLKPASYEVRPGRKFIRWDEQGKSIELEIDENGSFELPPNTISFIQIEPKIRLPDYIAIRFNLRITHVHRGLLLGTGPLIDPGFSGVPLIPLHNLTAESFRIRGDEGLIWVEFTKTAPDIVKSSAPPYARRGSFYPLEPRKTDRDIEYYFYRANGLQPIRSSIPGAIKNAEVRAEQAEKSAAGARNASRAFAGIGIVAILALVVGLFQLFAQVNGNLQTTVDLASTISTNADRAKTDADRAIANSQANKQDLETARAEIEDLRGQLGTMGREVERLRSLLPTPKSPTK